MQINGSASSPPAATPLVSAIDRSYLLPWAVMITSFRAYNPDRPMDAYLLHYDLTADDLEFVRRLAQSTGIAAHPIRLPPHPFILFETRNRRSLASRKTMSPVAYAKTAIDAYLPGTVQRALLMDADIVVAGPLGELLDLPLTAPLAAVGNIPRKHGKQFNTGVVLADIGEWRRRGVWKSMQAFLFDYSDALHTHDQHTLNLFFGTEWQKVGLRYNYIEDHFRLEAQNLAYGPEEIRAARDDPAIIHYAIGGDKPWRVASRHPRASLYRDWMEKVHPLTSGLNLVSPS